MVRLGEGLMALGAVCVALGLGLVGLQDSATLSPERVEFWVLVAGVVLLALGLFLRAFGLPKPRVVLAGSEPFHVERVSFGFPMDVLCMRVVNEKSWSGRAAATGVSATFWCEGPGTEHLPALNARWSDTPQPPNLPNHETPQLAVDLKLNLPRQINLVVKEPHADDCYLFNNDSYYLPVQHRGQNPQWRMAPGEYRAVVRVSGDDFEKHFACRFVNRGHGRSLEVLEITR